jgi:hypothetical protein
VPFSGERRSSRCPSLGVCLAVWTVCGGCFSVVFGWGCADGGARAPVEGEGGGPVFVSALVGSSTGARFLRVRVRSRASAQRER